MRPAWAERVTMDPRVTELHCIMPMTNIGTVMTHASQRQYQTGAKRAVPPRHWARAVDAVVAPMIDSVGRVGVQSRTHAVFRDTALPKLNSGELRVEHAEDRIEELP